MCTYCLKERCRCSILKSACSVIWDDNTILKRGIDLATWDVTVYCYEYATLFCQAFVTRSVISVDKVVCQKKCSVADAFCQPGFS